jgi:hypothetical protein
MRQMPQAHRVLHMLPLQPRDYPELSKQQENLMAQDLADSFNDYICEELIDKLSEMAEEILEKNHIDPSSPEGSDLVFDLIRRITVTCN